MPMYLNVLVTIFNNFSKKIIGTTIVIAYLLEKKIEFTIAHVLKKILNCS